MKILFQGDSITDCGRIKEDSSNMGEGYPYLINGALGFDEPGQHIFINRGISGNRSVDLYARIKEDIINIQPDVISILVGVNDVWHEFSENPRGISDEKYFKIYSMLIEEIRETLPRAKIMILEPFALKGIGNEKYWNVFKMEVEKRAEKAKKIAEKYNLRFVPLQKKFEQMAEVAPNDHWLKDGVHPTVMGHELIKGEWIKAFDDIRE